MKSTEVVKDEMLGKVFENWKVFKRDFSKTGARHTFYICKCKCGAVASVRSDMLKSGRSLSCGCLKKEKLSKRVTTHGMTNTPLHKVWLSLKQRCINPNNKRFKYYGEKGVTVCKEWQDNFLEFYNWSMKNGYKKGMTIDRIDNDGNYCPSNCRYITNKQQQFNRSNNRYITVNDVTLTVTEWSEMMKIRRDKLNWRLNNGWEVKDLFKP